MRLKKLRQNNQGFTLVELLVVVVILGILSSLTIILLRPAFFYGKGRDSRRQSDLETVRSALQQYYLDNGRLYPNTTYANLQTPLASYLDRFPTDPGGGTYTYSYSAGDRKCYQLSANMEVVTPATYRVCGGSMVCQAANSFCQ